MANDVEEEAPLKSLDNIQNPIVKRALQRRARDFMFNYGDVYDNAYSDYEQQSYQRGDWDEYSEHHSESMGW